MRTTQIQVTTTPIKMQFSHSMAKLEVDQPNPPTLDIQTNLVKVEIHSEAPKIQIDQSQCFAESGLKKPIALSEDFAAYSRQKMLESIGKIADQGNQLLDIHLGGNAIADIGHYNAYDQFVRDYNMVTMPMSRPKIDLIRGTVDIQVKGGNMINNTRYQPPVFQYTPPNLNIYVKQYPSIQFSTTV